MSFIPEAARTLAAAEDRWLQAHEEYERAAATMT